MSGRPRLLDGCCGAGGCSVGYERAGFEVEGWDLEPHDDYPFELHIGDVLDVLADRDYLDSFDVVHVSPPCPRYSTATPAANRDGHPDLIGPVRRLLEAWGGVYVIENVPGAPLLNPVRLCGSSFGLGVRRHRLFESNVLLTAAECDHTSQGQPWGVYGDHGDLTPVRRPNGTSRGNKARDVAHAREVLGIDWMTRWDDLADAIPPAMTAHLGQQILAHLETESACASVPRKGNR